MHSDAWCFPQLITTTTLRYSTAAIIIAVVSSLRFNNKSSGNRLWLPDGETVETSENLKKNNTLKNEVNENLNPKKWGQS